MEQYCGLFHWLSALLDHQAVGSLVVALQQHKDQMGQADPAVLSKA